VALEDMRIMATLDIPDFDEAFCTACGDEGRCVVCFDGGYGGFVRFDDVDLISGG
jgi:hypothetical protein